MAYVNIASLTKRHRASQIITDIGADGRLLIYTGSVPASPDMAATGILLANLALSNVAAVASFAVQDAVISDPGSAGTNGSYSLTFTGGGGTGATGYFIVSANECTSVVISDPGHGYTSAPTIGGFGTASLSGTIVLPVMTALVTFNAISTATAVGTGTAGWARVTQSDITVGILDLDIGITNAASVVIDNTTILSGGSVSCSAQVLIEA